MDRSGKLNQGGLKENFGLWREIPSGDVREDGEAMKAEALLETVLAGELRELLVISYIVLGNNTVTNRYIEQRFNIPVHAWSALYAVSIFPGIRAKEIKLLFPRPQNTISRAVSLLERRGYLIQEVSKSDGREKRLFITSDGEQLLTEMIDVSRKRQDEWLAPLSRSERETFFKLARRIAEGSGLLKSDVMVDHRSEADQEDGPNGKDGRSGEV